MTERTNVWDTIGVISYGLLFALGESLLIFLVVALLGLLLPSLWGIDKRIGFLSLLALLACFWAIVSQLLFLWNVGLPAGAVEFFRNSHHPLRILYATSLSVVTVAILMPVYWFLRVQNAVAIMQNLIERLSLLTMFYLFFDVLGIMIILIRNL